jgi:hypothetical protein
MADVVVRAPNGDLVEVPEAEYQKALNAGYQNVPQEEADAARSEFVSAEGEQAAVSAGMMSAPDEAFSPGREALAKGVSAATFGLGGLSDPTSRITGQRFQAEYPGSALAAEVAGQLPLAIATGGVGEGLVAGAAGATRLARAGVAAADFAGQAAVGGAQTEAEQARLEGREFSATNAAVAGLVGEAFGRTAGVGFSKAIGASRNLIARTEQRAVAQDTADALSRGGFLNDFRVAAHADQYQNELARLAADDLDALETGFAEVSRQDRKRARITRVVEDHPAEQAAVRAETLGEMQSLYEALYAEVGTGTAPGPAKRMLDQLRERMDLLAEKPTGARLWRTLDENRQALQDYAQDLHQAYETAPGSAWLSREALQRLDASERVTRETLLREDVWGTAAAKEQAAYNVPFNEKYFPTAKTVRGKLMFSTATDARGFPVFRGDPAKVRAFFGRGVDDVDASRLGEQFSEYLDGVEAIARAGERDTPKAARDTLEAVRRLRKAQSHAEFIQATSARMGRRADVAEVGVGVAAGVAGAASGGLAGAAAGGIAAQTVRGLRTVHWLSQAARKLGWAGSPESMAAMLGRDALPTRFGPDVPVNYVDDLVTPSKPPSGAPSAPSTPPGGVGGPSVPPAPPGGPGGAGAIGRGLTPSMRADALRGSWAPSGAPPAGGTLADDLAEPTGPSIDDLRPGRAERADRPTVAVAGREVGRGQAEVLETDQLREAGLKGRREAERLEALTEGEFRDVVRELRASGTDEADAFARKLEADLAALKTAGLVVAGAGGIAAAAAGEEESGAAMAGAAGLGLALGKGGLFKTLRAEAKRLAASGLDDATVASRLARTETNPAAEWADRLGLPEGRVQNGAGIMAHPVGGQAGSNPGGWYQAKNGTRYYVKQYADPQQAVDERAANLVYRVGGRSAQPAPRSMLITTPDGGVAHASVDQAADGWAPKALDAVTAEEAREFAKGFWYDVLLANWDVVGQTGDNLLWSGGKAMRLDNGSSLRFRAQGDMKPGAALYNLTEIDGFFNAELNPQYAGLLKKAGVASPKDLRAELHLMLRDLENGMLAAVLDNSLPADQVPMVMARFNQLQTYAKKLETPGERRLREGLGRSMRLGAMFEGKPTAAHVVVEDAKAVLDPPPPVDESRFPAPYLANAPQNTPELMRLVEVSRRAVLALPEAERDAISTWVGSSTNMRDYARLGDIGPKAQEWMSADDLVSERGTAQAFESAIEKLTVLNPTQHGTLFRFLDLGEDGLAEALKREHFVVSAPTSTGYVPDSNFGSTEFRFESADRAAALIGHNPGEAEMLLLPGSRFEKVSQHFDPERGGFTFIFREVPETSKSPGPGSIGHLGLGPFALAAGAASAEAAARGEPVATEDGVAPSEAAGAPPAGAAFGAAAALFNRSSARLVANAAKRLFSLTAEPVVKATARLAYSRSQIEARRAELTEWHQNPDAPGGLIERLAEGLREAPPDAFAATSAASYRALAFLRSRLPQSGKAAPIAANRGIPVSAEAAMKYARYEQAALTPGDAIREASESGHLSAELLETLEELYPELLAELRVAAYQAVQDAGPRQLSIQAKTQYARLFDGQGELADPTFSMAATRVYAAAYEQVAAVSPPKAPNPSGPHVSATAQAVASPQPWRTA